MIGIEILVNCKIIISFGRNPRRGGSPLRDKIVRSREVFCIFFKEGFCEILFMFNFRTVVIMEDRTVMYMTM